MITRVLVFLFCTNGFINKQGFNSFIHQTCSQCRTPTKTLNVPSVTGAGHLENGMSFNIHDN